MTQHSPQTPTQLIYLGTPPFEIEDVITGEQQVHLVEPNPHRAARLKGQYRKTPHIQIHATAISDTTAEQTYYRLNMSQYSGLAKPTMLQTLYPGLTIKATTPVKPKSLDTLFQSFSLTSSHNQLVISLPGQVINTLLAIQQKGWLAYFQSITCHQGIQSLFENESTSTQTQQWLANQGYDQPKTLQQDPDFVTYTVEYNPMFDQVKTLQAQNKKLETQSNDAFMIVDDQRLEIKEAQKGLKNHQAWLKQTQTKLEATQKENQQLKQQCDKLTQERNRKEAEKATLQKALDKKIDLLEHINAQAKDLQTQLETKQQQLIETTQAEKSKEQALAKLKQELKDANNTVKAQAERNEQLTKERDDYKTWFQNRKKQAQENHQAKQTLQAEIKQLTSELETAKKSKQDAQKSHNDLTSLESKIQQLFATQKEEIKQYTNALGQHITKTQRETRQNLAASFNVNQTLIHGNHTVDFDSDTLSPEAAQHLVQWIDQNEYDLIIEFGSGLATQIMAKTLINKKQSQAHPVSVPQTHRESDKAILNAHVSSPSNDQLSTANDLATYDLPKKIISFEHNQTAYEDNQQTLNKLQLASMVAMHYAPLVDYRHQSEDCLFYHCQAHLQQLSEVYQGRQAKILIRVGGPVDQENPTAIYPVMPQLLNTLGEHRLDIIIDETVTTDTQQVMDKWQYLLQQRDLTYQIKHILSENKLIKVEVNV